jgi:hypothetical protein
MEKVKNDMAARFPDVRAFFQSGSMVDAILNSGMPAPIDVQVNTRDLNLTYSTAQDLARRFRQLPGVGQIYIPQDMNYPAIRLNIDRVHAGELGLTSKGHRRQRHHRPEFQHHDRPQLLGGLRYRQRLFPHRPVRRARPGAIHNLVDLKSNPLRASNLKEPTTLDTVVKDRVSPVPHRDRSLPDPARRRISMSRRRARISAN